MSTKIFVNLAVKDLNKSVAFFTQVGYSFNPQFTDENATCMIISEDIYVMLLVEPFFKTFVKKELADTSKTVEALICLSTENREQLDEIVDKAMAAGATEVKPPIDQGWMYSRSFNDLDGHHWEYVFMDMEAAAQAQQG